MIQICDTHPSYLFCLFTKKQMKEYMTVILSHKHHFKKIVFHSLIQTHFLKILWDLRPIECPEKTPRFARDIMVQYHFNIPQTLQKKMVSDDKVEFVEIWVRICHDCTLSFSLL